MFDAIKQTNNASGVHPAFHSPGGDRATADHRWPSLHHPARYTTRANPPRHLPGAPCTRPHPLANHAMDPK